jgi:DNA-binding NarL/FixJ family response regulator
MTIRILIVDDHAVVAEGLQALISAQHDMEVVGLAENGHEAVRKCAELQPDLVVMDNSMPELNGTEATRIITKRSPGVRVVMLSMHSTSAQVQRAFAAGVGGYVLKGSVGRELLDAVRAVDAGRRYLSRSLEEGLLDLLGTDGSEDPVQRLSARERQVLQLMAEGASMVAISELLSLSRKTVETYRSRMMDKLEIHDLAGLIRFAYRHGLISAE